jgi:hypothetical protein
MLPRPVEVLHDGHWVPGSLVAVRRERDGRWRGLVSYTERSARVGALGTRELLALPASGTAPLAYYHWRPGGMLRRPGSTMSSRRPVVRGGTG